MTLRPPAPVRTGARWADAAWCAVRFGRPVGRGRGLASRSLALLWRPVGGGACASDWAPCQAHGCVTCHARARLDGPVDHLRGPYAWDVHLRVNPDAPEQADSARYADVLVVRESLAPAAAHRRANELLVRYPGCLVVAVPDSSRGCALAVRDGGDAWAVRRQLPADLIASVAHSWLSAGGSRAGLRAAGISVRGRAADR
ncbi:hypothetical protein ACFT9I_15840 [Streptomyces sp. NPDC057137]|uniref:hypothetical protein n=1 Tax=Streptomyces sp. NPDC057137 TaxID=3346030 RepID=UPI00363AC473